MSSAGTVNFYYYTEAYARVFLPSHGRISIGEIPKSGISKSKTMHISMLMVHFQIGLENILNPLEYMGSGKGPRTEPSSVGHRGLQFR